MFQVFVFYACVLALAALMAALVLAGMRQVGRLLLRNLKPVALAALLPLAALLTDFAGEKNTNMPMRVIQPVASQTFSSCGAITNAGWLAHGAYEDWFRIPATNWWVRTADGWLDGVTVFACCEFRPDIRTTNAFPRPFPQKLSLAPLANWHMLTNREALAASHESLFWHGVTESNTLVMTWQNGLYERCATNLVSFQAELFNNGSVAYRYDGSPVATNDFVVPLELPFDRDGDGLENSVDPEPDVAGPDAHGTSAEWYNVVCSNVLEAVAGDGDPPVELMWREGVNSNAYYFVDVVAERGPAPIRFTGDRPSRLGDPAVVARAGETNRVPLLIGVDYAVTSDTPFSVSFPVDYKCPEVETNGPCVARIRWPLDFQFTESITPSNRTYAVTVVPYDPGGEFSWGAGGGEPMRGEPRRDGGCTCVSYDGHGVVFGCTEQCQCAGTCMAVGTYSLENASFPFAGGECRCGFDDPEGPEGPPEHDATDGASLSIEFSKGAVIFEDAYQNSDGSSVGKRSTRVRLTVSAYGGTRGGSLVLGAQNLGKLSAVAGGQISLPPTLELAAQQSFYTTCVYEAAAMNGDTNDVSVAGYFIESGTGARIDRDAVLTVVQLFVAPERPFPPGYPNRHTFGVCERMNIEAIPKTLRGFSWNSSELLFEDRRDGSRQYFIFRLDEGACDMTFMYGNASYTVHAMCLRPHDIVCRDQPEILHYGLQPGHAGGVGMYMELTLMPDTVRFEGIRVMERVAYGTPTGYFAQEYFRPWWNHGTEQGALTPQTVDPCNNFGDAPRIVDECPQYQTGGWSVGTIVWPITSAWREPSDFSEKKGWFDFVVKEQKATIDAAGTVGEEKFGWRVERDIQGHTNVVWQAQGANGP